MSFSIQLGYDDGNYGLPGGPEDDLMFTNWDQSNSFTCTLAEYLLAGGTEDALTAGTAHVVLQVTAHEVDPQANTEAVTPVEDDTGSDQRNSTDPALLPNGGLISGSE